MQKNYSTFVMPRHAMLLNIFLEFSNNDFRSSFSLLVISLTFRLTFLFLYALSRILSTKSTMMKVQYPLIHTNQLTHPFLHTLMKTMTVVSLKRMMVRTLRQFQCSSNTGLILLMRCGRATCTTCSVLRSGLVRFFCYFWTNRNRNWLPNK